MHQRRSCALAVALLGVVTLAGCGGGVTPRARVARDLGCTTEETGVIRAEPKAPGQTTGRWHVVGCGRSAIYVCSEPVRDCWREGPVVSGAPFAPPAAETAAQ